MESIQVPYYALNGQQVANENVAMLRTKLSEFCLNQLRRLKLVTSTFGHNFDLRAGVRERAKDMAKLSRVLTRNLVKQSPYLANALTAGGRPLIEVSGADLVMRGCTYGTESHRSLARYARSVNYLCRKHSVPAELVVAAFVGDESTPASVSVGLCITVSYPTEISPLSTAQSYLDWVESNRAQLAEQGRDPDAVYSSSSLWRTASPHTWHSECFEGRLRGCGIPQLSIPERVFLHLPTALHVMHTISRKFAYASNAFTIRAGEGA